MLGWFSAASVRASRWNRAVRSASRANTSGRILIATSRPSRLSRARYTSPIPPAPREAVISYEPNRVPAGRVRRRDYMDESGLVPSPSPETPELGLRDDESERRPAAGLHRALEPFARLRLVAANEVPV